MSDLGEKLLSGEINGREYFQELTEESLNNSTFAYDSLGVLKRLDTAAPLDYLPGDAPSVSLDDAQLVAAEHLFLKMPIVRFEE